MLASSNERRLARWILAQETAGREAASVGDAAVRVWNRLCLRLAHVFTRPGCDVLGKRAVYLAQGEFPFLKGENGTVGVDELTAILENRDQVEAAAAAEAVYANFTSLLVTFIGEDLALRAIRDVWPGASLDDLGTTAQEAQA